MQQVHLYLQNSTFGFLLSNKLSFKYQPLKLNPFCQEENLSKMLFSRCCIDEWNNVTTVIRYCKSVSILKKSITYEKKRKTIIILSLYLLYVKLLFRLRLQFSHLHEHKLRHGLGDTINALSTCGSEVETTEHFPSR